MTKGGIYKPGHDSRVRSSLLDVVRKGGDSAPKAKAALRAHGWSVPKLKK